MEDDEAYADEARELQEEASGNQSAFSAFTGFLGGLFGGSKAKSTQPAVKIFSTKTFSDGITYADKPADGKISEGTCVDIRRRFVASVERALKENGIPDRNRVGFIQELSAALLADDVKGKPLEVNDPNVTKALKFATSEDTMYKDDVSTSVKNRGTVRVDTAKFLGSLLAQNLLGMKLGDKNAVSWSGVAVHEGVDGFLNVTIRDLKMNEVAKGGFWFKLLQ